VIKDKRARKELKHVRTALKGSLLQTEGPRFVWTALLEKVVMYPQLTVITAKAVNTLMRQAFQSVRAVTLDLTHPTEV
jgi:hypothetical protein